MSKYFSPQADPKLFTCACGECPPDFTTRPSSRLLAALDDLREALGRPVVVTSGVRCPVYNAKVGGVEGSEHTQGDAADLHISNGLDRFSLVQAALKAGIVRLGVAETFLHIGVGVNGPAQRVLWLYQHA